MTTPDAPSEYPAAQADSDPIVVQPPIFCQVPAYALWEKTCIALILLAALFFRVCLLNEKPLHFDEGVNGNFLDRMLIEGGYRYDPSNYHGPLHFYVLFAAQTLLGRDPWVLRLPVALLSTAAVGLVFALRAQLGRTATLFAGFAMAVSPGLVFYGRDAIHESWMVFFLLLTFWGLAGLQSTKKPSHLWAFGMGICGMLLTKETYLVHLIAMGLALPTLWVLERFSPSTVPPAPTSLCTSRHWVPVLGTAGFFLVFFYSGGFLHWQGLLAFFESLLAWTQTGTGGESGHEKPWHYWIELLLRYEWPAFLGLCASVWTVLPKTQRALRYLAIYAGGTLVAYSIVPYKTPWCLISMIWPWILLFGAGVARLASCLDRWCVYAVAGLALAYSSGMSALLNFWSATDEEEPYVYVQTLPEIEDLLTPLRTATQNDPRLLHAPGYVLLPELFPWTWLLGRHSRVVFLNPPDFPEELEPPEFALVDPNLLETFEARLEEPYFKQPLHVRGSSPDDCFIFLRASTFAYQFPERSPEFVPPPSGEPAPAPEPPTSVESAPPSAHPAAPEPSTTDQPTLSPAKAASDSPQGPQPFPPLPRLNPETGKLVPEP